MRRPYYLNWRYIIVGLVISIMFKGFYTLVKYTNLTIALIVVVIVVAAVLFWSIDRIGVDK
jgi:hypothetical protein